MNIDYYTVKGRGKDFNQDYILTSAAENIPISEKYIIVSDGCSSVLNAGFGASVLSYSAESILNTSDTAKLKLADDFRSELLEIALRVVEPLKLKKSILSATLLMGFVSAEEFIIHAFGDGNIILVDNENKITFYTISYDNNMPYYLVYDKLIKSDTERKMISKKIEIFSSDGSAPLKVIDSWKEEYDTAFSIQLKLSEYKFIGLSTDGLQSFSNMMGDSLDLDFMIKNIFAFKNLNGLFLKRRLNRFINEQGNNKFYNSDDFSIGVLHTNNKS